MKTSLTHPKIRSGFTLIILMASIVIILVAFASIMYWITTNGTQMNRNSTYLASQAAAEAATEMTFAQMDQDYLYQALNPSVSAYESLAPDTTTWPVHYTFNTTVRIGSASSTLAYIGGQYTNLLGYGQTNIITSTATPVGQLHDVPATVGQAIVFAEVPAYQFAIFYNLNLDISPGQPMAVNGATFCNQNIFCYPPAQMTFNGVVEAAGKYYNYWDTNGEQAANIAGSPTAPIFNQGNPISHVDPLILPIGAGDPTGNNGNNASSVEAIINLPPLGAMAPGTNAYSLANQVYDFNAASLIVSNSMNGYNSASPQGTPFTVYLQDSVPAPVHVSSNGVAMHWIQLTNDYYVVANSYGGHTNYYSGNWVPNFRFTNVVSAIRWTNTLSGPNYPIGTNIAMGTNWVYYAGFSFLTNVTFKDYRESATVQAVQIDVSQLRMWITNGSVVNGGSNWDQQLSMDFPSGLGINSIYVYNDVPFIGGQQLPAVSVVNGQRLPASTNALTRTPTHGLTVVTPQPLYVIGNYNVQIDGSPVVTGSHNTADTYPAGFMADSITILSADWPSDWGNSSLGSRATTSTTINAACLEGIVPSTGGGPSGDGPNAHYSGGIENFLRLLENWPGSTLTYNGSILVMFPSLYATNYWQMPGAYYNVPTRNWGFDTNFTIQAHLPPLTPAFRTVVRNQWVGN